MNCPLCASVNTKQLFRLTAANSIFGCKSCGLEFLSPQLKDIELENIYTESYYSAWGLKGKEENPSLREMKMATFDLRLNLARNFCSGNRILDVGCATGYLLESAEKKGYEAYGVEFSDYSSAIAKKKFGDSRIFKGIIEDCTFPEDFFDVITMFDLIEHARDPKTVLKKALFHLKKDGLVLISTPDTGTFSHKVMGRKWSHYKPEHFFYFNKNSMKKLAESCGLEMVFYERSRKFLNLNYIINQLRIYKHLFFTPAANIGKKLIPSRLKSWNFPLAIGEMTVVLKKIN